MSLRPTPATRCAPNERRTRAPIWAISAVVVGLVVVGGVIAFAVYRQNAVSDLDRFEYTVPLEERAAWTGVASVVPPLRLGVQKSDSQTVDGATVGGDHAPDSAAQIAPAPKPESAVNIALRASLYPGALINPRYWSAPNWAGSEPFAPPVLPEGFTAVPWLGAGTAQGTMASPIRLRIPAIGLDAPVEGLQMIGEGSSIRYENPDNVVGHIPATANPGENGAGWYFGHHQSYFAGEGSVFRRVPKILDLIKNDPVDVYLYSAGGEFLYRVTGTKVVHRDELQLEQSNRSSIILVASWPPYVYDRRFLATAELLAVRWENPAPGPKRSTLEK